MALDSNYWENRYHEERTGWDLGEISVPLRDYVDQIEDKSIKILIPGCGNGHEAVYLHSKGFTNVHILDYAPAPLKNFLEAVPDFPKEHLHQADFFEHDGKYDLIIEQAFFCAITPDLRESYRERMHHILNVNGKLVGLLFEDEFKEDGPPWGGHRNEYKEFFKSHFDIQVMELADNSIKPRRGREVFTIMVKK